MACIESMWAGTAIGEPSNLGTVSFGLSTPLKGERSLYLENLKKVTLIIYRRTAIMHGRPNSIAKSEISTDLPTNCPTFDSPNFSNMMMFIDLVSWTGEVADTL